MDIGIPDHIALTETRTTHVGLGERVEVWGYKAGVAVDLIDGPDSMTIHLSPLAARDLLQNLQATIESVEGMRPVEGDRPLRVSGAAHGR